MIPGEKLRCELAQWLFIRVVNCLPKTDIHFDYCFSRLSSGTSRYNDVHWFSFAVCCIKISRAHACTTPRYRCCTLLIDGLNESLRFVAWYRNALVIRIIGVHFRKDYSFYIVWMILKHLRVYLYANFLTIFATIMLILVIRLRTFMEIRYKK